MSPERDRILVGILVYFCVAASALRESYTFHILLEIRYVYLAGHMRLSFLMDTSASFYPVFHTAGQHWLIAKANPMPQAKRYSKNHA
ncbi:hypothetical protein SAMN05216404_102272 [Nitrosospira multiformis]|uniref:Uncharacterized protein n=1 Tax=Nitrosospira multiformis TaxID=1231 RepID=A0A1H8DJ18_9PROT|nr:hypothetical protein SAMN05216404_102272 [Nitrosospira multiformis]